MSLSSFLLSLIQPLSGNALWLIDRDAAKMLTVGNRE